MSDPSITDLAARPTRGEGILEGFLSRQRVKIALSLIPSGLTSGRVLDVGCGSYPIFLSALKGYNVYGLDRALSDDVINTASEKDITLTNHDFIVDGRLPFESGSFTIVTMLAVFEHLEHDVLALLLSEIHRVLAPGGAYIMTTPAVWTDGLLRLMARIGLVSQEEIDEHVDAYGHSRIREALVSAGFSDGDIGLGHFLGFMNNWGRAIKKS